MMADEERPSNIASKTVEELRLTQQEDEGHGESNKVDEATQALRLGSVPCTDSPTNMSLSAAASGGEGAIIAELQGDDRYVVTRQDNSNDTTSCSSLCLTCCLAVRKSCDNCGFCLAMLLCFWCFCDE